MFPTYNVLIRLAVHITRYAYDLYNSTTVQCDFILYLPYQTSDELNSILVSKGTLEL